MQRGMYDKSKENNPNWKGGHYKKCLTCNKDFWVCPSQESYNYCCKSCYSKTRIGDKNPFFGKTHSKESLIKQSNSKLGLNNPMFGKKVPLEVRLKISKSKKNKPRFDMVGNKNHMWRGGYEPYYGPNWKEQRRLARLRDNYKCQNCGKVEQLRELEVHHLKSFKSFNKNYDKANDLDNLVTLCMTCHRKIEFSNQEK
jgi:5-methylcytosine-specific restriction endonuclease McrA